MMPSIVGSPEAPLQDSLNVLGNFAGGVDQEPLTGLPDMQESWGCL